MIDDEPLWRWKSSLPLTQWYGHVHLLSGCVVGEWFAVDRNSGNLIWQRSHFRANSIAGIDSGVIVAYEMRSDGPWTAGFGCYGLSLHSGELIWTSHGDGMRSGLLRLLDFLPGFTNGMRDNPSFVTDGKVYCSSGRVLNVLNGELIEKLNPDAVNSRKPEPSEASRLYDSAIGESESSVSIGDLLIAHPNTGKQRGKWSLIAKNSDQNIAWEFDLQQTGLHIDGNFYSYRLAGLFVYLIVSEEPRYRPHPTKRQTVVPNPTRWHLLCLDLTTGQIVQKRSLGNQLLAECRIEDVDPQGILIGTSGRELIYFRRQAQGC